MGTGSLYCAKGYVVFVINKSLSKTEKLQLETKEGLANMKRYQIQRGFNLEMYVGSGVYYSHLKV